MGKVKDATLYQKMKQRKQQAEILSKTVSYLTLALGGFIMTIPFLWMVVTSLKEKGAVFTYPPEWIPRAHVTTMHEGKEKKVQSAEHQGKTIKFVEVSSKIVTPAEMHTIVYEVVPENHIECSVILLEDMGIYGRQAFFNKSDLVPANKKQNFSGKEYDVYTLKSAVVFKDAQKYRVGVPVIIVSEEEKAYKILDEKRIVIKEELQESEESVKYKGERKSIVSGKVTEPETGREILAVKIDSVTFRPAEWDATVVAVKDSGKVKAIVQYLDEEFGELSGQDVTIAYDKSDLQSTGETATDLSGQSQKLFTLDSDPSKKFSISESQIQEYETEGELLEGVKKYRAIPADEGVVQMGIKIGYKTHSYFTDIKKVKLNYNNYYKALFKAIPPIKAENLKGFNMLTVLLMIFGQIPAFIVYFINSLTVSMTVTLLELTTSCLAAYAFARLQWKGRDKVFMLYLSTMMIPGQVTMIPVFIVIKQLNWIDTYKALIIPHAFSTWSVFMLRQFFLSIPQSLEEAAYLDGSTRAGILVSVIIPLSKAALGTLFIFRFQAVYNDFVWPLIVTNSDYMKVVPVGLASFQGVYSTDWTLLMAATVIVVIPVLIVYIAFQKNISTGIKLGGAGK